VVERAVLPQLFQSVYEAVERGVNDALWNSLPAENELGWRDVTDASSLRNQGDSVASDQTSPSGEHGGDGGGGTSSPPITHEEDHSTSSPDHSTSSATRLTHSTDRSSTSSTDPSTSSTDRSTTIRRTLRGTHSPADTSSAATADDSDPLAFDWEALYTWVDEKLMRFRESNKPTQSEKNLFQAQQDYNSNTGDKLEQARAVRNAYHFELQTWRKRAFFAEEAFDEACDNLIEIRQKFKNLQQWKEAQQGAIAEEKSV
ncbi:unnamed protein product, partial [Closterium sp. NIES-54]